MLKYSIILEAYNTQKIINVGGLLMYIICIGEDGCKVDSKSLEGYNNVIVLAQQAGKPDRTNLLLSVLTIVCRSFLAVLRVPRFLPWTDFH